ncbi:membrane-flanked domain-containing protein [Planococcus antarcticus DSM 14505]|uniref:Membrane-flanked domain-containing protein n=1 Tax=Planococcus antarcticus DSM 14505 TaxID=1185653 RepID=A0AA87IJG5_9BACL|nr:PH domain-containing protein [Planococcus antarcticus]EIM06003.1 membrane-flanked domain-containing protein [Planococcus antarcticus DSM 14505]
MIAIRRHHPATVLFKIGKLLRNSIFIILVLFVFQANNSSTLFVYGRYAFLLFFLWSLVSAVLNWLTTTYALDDQRFYLRRGIFNKTDQSIPFSKVQNINRHTSFSHRLLGLTSISFETGIAGEDSSVKFEVTTKKEVLRLESAVQEHKESLVTEQLTSEDDTGATPATEHEQATQKQLEEHIIHFQPTRRDLLKASMTSFSFLLLVPLLASLYYNVSEFVSLEERLDGIGASLLASPWMIAIVAILIILASFLFGILHSFIKYGKYEISSDSQRVYIKKGVLSHASFSIAKERVQAIEITQSFTKRILGLAEVKLISAGSLSLGSEELNISSLYPFLPKKKAYAIVSELLPGYRIQEDMQRLPRRALWVRMLKPSWLWLIATALLFYFQPKFLGIDNTWWIASSVLLLLILASRILDFLHTRYCLHDELIQLKNGGFTSTLFVTKREKIIEVEIKQNRIQRAFGLSSLQTVTRARPIHTSYLEDIPDSLASTFRHWYRERSKEVKLDTTN